MTMRIGIQYYRTPNPERRLWRDDFIRMREMGLDTVRFWIYWSKVNPSSGDWDWDELDELYDHAAKNNLGVVGQLVPESHPRWFVERHDNLVPLDQNGTRAQLLGHTIAAASSYPGITFDHPEAQAGTATFLDQVVRRYAGHPAAESWDVWNEIQPFSFSHDSVTTAAWQVWLRSRFADLTAFREFAKVDVTAFERVPLLTTDLPDQGTGTLNLRVLFREWISDRIVQEMSRRVGIVRLADSGHPIVSHRRSHLFIDPVVDEARIVDELDQWGTSNYASPVTTDHDVDDLALNLALIRGVAGSKPFWLAETTAGRMYHLYGHTTPTGAQIRATLAMAFAHGASSALLWQYRHERFGQEASGFGLVNFDGSDNDRVAAVEQVAAALRREDREVRRDQAMIALVYDPKVLILERSMTEPVPQAVSIIDELTGWYRASHAAGLSADILTPTGIARDGISPDLRVIVLPMNAIADDALGAVLLDWVANGGTLVQTAFTGMLDEELMAPTLVPAGVVGRVLGSHITARDYPAGAIEVDGLPGHLVRERFRDESADDVSVVRIAMGSGEVVHLGSLPGTANLLGRDGLADWIRDLVGPISGTQVSSNEAVMIERIRLDGSEVLCLFNRSEQDQSVDLFPQGDGGVIVDMLRAERHPWRRGEAVRIAIGPKDCAVREVRHG